MNRSEILIQNNNYRAGSSCGAWCNTVGNCAVSKIEQDADEILTGEKIIYSSLKAIRRLKGDSGL